MRIMDVELDGVKILEPVYFDDNRGFFSEVYSQRELEKHEIACKFVQDSHSYSKTKGTIRGIHFQNHPAAQAKIVRCTNGEIMDVIVDLRKNSPTYKKWISVVLSRDNRKQIFIPEGFGHAFLTLTDCCEVLYKFTDFYNPTLYQSLAWNDPQLNIQWGISNPIMSPKDAHAPTIDQCNINL